MANGIEWKPEQLALIRRLWKRRDTTLEQIAAALSRTTHAVEVRAWKMGLGKRAGSRELSACRHCERPSVKSRGRGLCWKCSETPEIRDKYPNVSKFASNRARGIPDHEPTVEELGALTAAKRAELGCTARDKARAIIVGHFGPATTYPQAVNHLHEDRLTITPEEFAAVMREVFPPSEDWQEVLLRKRLVQVRVTQRRRREGPLNNVVLVGGGK